MVFFVIRNESRKTKTKAHNFINIINLLYCFVSGIIAFIDRFQANMSELTSLEPNSLADHRKKRMLLATLQNVSQIDFLVQTCRDQMGWDYYQTASYLRSNVSFQDRSSSKKTNSMLAATPQTSELNL